MKLSKSIAVAVLCCATPFAHGESVRPNIVLMIADDCTYTDLACYGGQAATPHLDRLCSEGMKFTNCFQAAPMCSPTRHCLYTGLYPVRSGAYPNHTFVKDGTRSVAHYLQAAGYRTALSGKTHIKPVESFPFEYSKDGPETKGTNPDFEVIEQLMMDSKEAAQPFLAVLCSNEPHTPYTEGDARVYPPDSLALPPNFVDTPATRDAFSKYLAEITYYDSQVGRMLDLLDKHELADSTLVVVLSEQGSSFPFAKWTCYDAGVRSGMVVRWPQRVTAGSTSDAIVEYADVTPTFVDVSGQPPQTHFDGKPLDGASFLPVLVGDKTTHKSYTYSLQTTRGIINGSDCYGIRSVSNGRYRLVWNLTPDQSFQNAVFTTSWWAEWVGRSEAGDETAKRLVKAYSSRPEYELYDVIADPWNMRNLADRPSMETVRRGLAAKLSEWMDQQGDLGQPTELKAKERQGRARKAKDSKPKKKRKAA